MPIVTAAEARPLEAQMRELGGSPWPEFLLHSPVMNRLFAKLYEVHPQCQYALLDESGATVRAVGNCVPVHWGDALEDLPDGGVEWAMISRYEQPDPPSANLLCAVQIVVAPPYLNSGLSAEMVRAMRKVAAVQGLTGLIAPVRPMWKHRYPLVPMERYVQWTRPDGLPYDPWLRVHARLGAKRLRVCGASLTIEANAAKWHEWTGLEMHDSGPYVLNGGLVPMHYDAGSDVGRYVEPNFWMRHP